MTTIYALNRKYKDTTGGVLALHFLDIALMPAITTLTAGVIVSSLLPSSGAWETVTPGQGTIDALADYKPKNKVGAYDTSISFTLNGLDAATVAYLRACAVSSGVAIVVEYNDGTIRLFGYDNKILDAAMMNLAENKSDSGKMPSDGVGNLIKFTGVQKDFPYALTALSQLTT